MLRKKLQLCTVDLSLANTESCHTAYTTRHFLINQIRRNVAFGLSSDNPFIRNVFNVLNPAVIRGPTMKNDSSNKTIHERKSLKLPQKKKNFVASIESIGILSQQFCV